MSTELSDEQLDYLLSSADRFVGQGDALVEELAAAIRDLRKSLITVNITGRTFRLDRLSECEDALDTVHVHMAHIESERDVLASIVRDLATAAAYSTPGDGCCKFCGWHMSRIGGPHNQATCIWVRAREWTQSQETP